MKLIEKYFKNIVVNLIFSAIIMLGFFVKAQILSNDILGTNKLAILLFCEFIMVLVLTTFIAYTMKTFPKQKLKLFFLIPAWSLVLFAEAFFAQKIHLSGYVGNYVFTPICALIYGITCGGLILSVCDYIKASKIAFLPLFLKNICPFLKTFFHNLAVIIVFSLVLFIPANGRSRTAENGPTPEQALATEKKLFPFILFFFIPFFVLTFIQLHEDISEKCYE